jgi:hypothetical protein
LICCGGTFVGVPLAWIARQTIEASRGAPSPDAAADSYLTALGKAVSSWARTAGPSWRSASRNRTE